MLRSTWLLLLKNTGKKIILKWPLKGGRSREVRRVWDWGVLHPVMDTDPVTSIPVRLPVWPWLLKTQLERGGGNLCVCVIVCVNFCALLRPFLIRGNVFYGALERNSTTRTTHCWVQRSVFHTVRQERVSLSETFYPNDLPEQKCNTVQLTLMSRRHVHLSRSHTVLLSVVLLLHIKLDLKQKKLLWSKVLTLLVCVCLCVCLCVRAPRAPANNNTVQNNAVMDR